MKTNEEQIEGYIKRREFSQAEPLLAERLRTDPDNADTHYFLGVLFQFQGKIGKSVQHLKKSLDLDPHHTDAAICLSVLYNDVGKYNEAKQIFEKANQSVSRSADRASATGSSSSLKLGVDRKFAVKHHELGDLYFRYRRYDESIEEYSKAIQLDSSNFETRIRRAKAYSKKGFVTRAIQDLQALKASNPHYIPARIQLGLLQFSQGNILDAELEWESVLDITTSESREQEEARNYLEMAKEARVKM